MNIKFPDIARIIKEVKRLFFVLRNDKEAQLQSRTLVLGIFVCFALYYGISTLFIEPGQKNLSKKMTERTEMKGGSPAQLNAAMAVAITNLEQQKNTLEEKITTLQFKEKLLREHWDMVGDEERFSKIIFTLLPSAPMSIEKNLDQVTLVDRRSKDAFDMHPMTLVGDAYFSALFDYLQYMESRPEIGTISNITIESKPTTKYDQEAKVHFSLMVSRLSLKESK
jgi:hypothetical protein